ncbi:palmitoyl-acyl carrier protein thioesterase, chloroplastic [Lactuca sativa]|uniref:Acyl-[acyl-carrier-protein] hydrolase n=1 Tax=Lactuca sativa TaxID=4236 RepID=A0A9R1VFT4_LACSA|nr:palmitoyl-acyl carrier protein thioesterase, chloroplastic [Lactuca sativa]KAJ0205348.1 hypothetical protein LSAT_V11C500264610 [Lactuca sativa]
MAFMITTASSITMNSSPYPNYMTSSKFGCIPGAMHEHERIKLKQASSWSLQFKAPMKVNATKVDAIDWSMVDPKKESPNMVSDLRVERMIHDDSIFQEIFCIRLYEVGPDETASIETLMNHLQETTANHMKKSGLMHDGFGFGSEEMSKHNLTWVMAKIQMIVDRYPIWGDIVQMETWKAAHGKNGVCCNLTLHDCKTGEILVRASSYWVMMNTKTRKLSKFPNEVRAKLEQIYVDKPPLIEQDTRTWSKSEEKINEHICKGLKPRWSDLDINQHVNNVKYVGLILESVPKTIIENYEIHSMTLDYYREFTKDNILQSFTSILTNNSDETSNYDIVDCQHLLRFDIDGDNSNIMKGRTRWRLKQGNK